MDSPFTHHLDTNYVPSAQDIEHIRADVAFHLEELEELENTIRELSSRRDEIQAYIDSHKALISHPRRLPRDIVQEIFLACLPTSRNAVMSHEESPMLLCRICSAWRDIALTTPTLWASLHVPIQFISGNECRLIGISEWLDRSAACPLSLSLIGDTWDQSWTSRPEDTTAIIELLAEHSDHWGRVELSRFSPQALLLLGEVHAPMLESIDVSGTFPVNVGLNLFKGRKLRNVSVRSMPLDGLVANMPLAWEQLTHLFFSTGGNGNGVSLHNAFLLLKKCRRIVSLHFNLNTSAVENGLSETISLPFIRTFAILDPYGPPAHCIDHLLENVRMLELREFRLPTVAFKSRPNFLMQLGRQSPLVERLESYLATFTRELFLEALELLPSLTRIDASGNRAWGSNFDTQQLLQLLTPGSEPHLTAVCPALKEIVVKECHTSVSEAVLLSFLQGRIDEGTGFRRLEIEFGGAQDKSLGQKIAPFQSRGLEIVLKFSHSWVPALPTQWSGLPSRQRS
ncbi:hypothetical protein DFH09DRAFT_1187237 [Mycena vulgaris]|nr:hypothetical protein DFH09DRAFT_1187237 [Mycena vulgaris]